LVIGCRLLGERLAFYHALYYSSFVILEARISVTF
jgi:hypothetical protein